jgi:regulator of sirC expression with transglutaminase-like and TPR domain
MMNELEEIREHFASVSKLPDAQIDLTDTSLLIARIAYPHLDTAKYQQYLDQLAKRLKERISPSSSAGDTLMEMNRILYDEEGFQGNRQDYFNPDNSFLNRVIDRRLGIPISLSLVCMEMSRRAGLRVSGISLPGHFITALSHPGGTLFMDPFNRGEILSEDECRQRVSIRRGSAAALSNDWMIPAGNKSILTRMLRNLKGIYQNLNHDLKVFEMAQWILMLDPDAPLELRDRGLLYESLGNTGQAVADLERYLAVAPEAPDRDLIEDKLTALRDSPQWLH